MVYILDAKVNMQSPFPDALEIPSPGEGTISDLVLLSEKKLNAQELQKLCKHYQVDRKSPGNIDKHHFIESQDSMIISAHAKDILEELEPGIHQFIKVNVKCVVPKYKKYYENIDYYYLKVCQSINALNIDRSEIKKDLWDVGTKYERIYYKLNLEKTDQIYFNRNLIEGKQLWRGTSFHLHFNIMMSDKLFEAWSELAEYFRAIPCYQI